MKLKIKHQAGTLTITRDDAVVRPLLVSLQKSEQQAFVTVGLFTQDRLLSAHLHDGDWELEVTIPQALEEEIEKFTWGP